MRKCLIVSAAMVMLATPGAWAASTTRFQLGDGGGVIVPVTIDQHGPFLMLLDTGASHSTIVQDVTDAIDARIVAQTNVISPISGALRPIVAVERLTIGPVTVDVLLPSVVANKTFDAKGIIRGLIGQDVLAGLRYTVDYKRRVIEWHDAPRFDDGIRLPLTFDNGRFLVSALQGSRTLRLVPDSGAAGLVLFGAKGLSALDVIALEGTVELSTADAIQKARAVRLRELRLGGRTWRDVPAVALDGDDRPSAEGDGLLPLHMFERVTFDGPAGVLILRPRDEGV